MRGFFYLVAMDHAGAIVHVATLSGRRALAAPATVGKGKTGKKCCQGQGDKNVCLHRALLVLINSGCWPKSTCGLYLSKSGEIAYRHTQQAIKNRPNHSVGADGKGEWCPRADLNHRHGDFQSPALPTELLGPASKNGLWAYTGLKPECPEGFI